VTKGTEVVTETKAVVYSLEQIDGIEMVFSAVDRLPPDTSIDSLTSPIHAAILPHHTLIAEKIGEFWVEIAASNPEPSMIVLVGPAHENQGSAEVVATDGAWETPFGVVASETAFVADLLASRTVVLDQNAFANEHSVGVHMPYLAKLFPETPVAAVIAKSSAGEAEAQAFVTALLNTLPEQSLMVMSVDFSHYLPSHEMDDMDARTLELISRRDYRAMDGLQPSHADSPFALESYFMLGDRRDWHQELVWHENSARVTKNFSADGTSYIVYFAHPQPPSLDPQPLTLTAAGDIMLGRGVAQALSRTTIEAAFGATAEDISGERHGVCESRERADGP